MFTIVSLSFSLSNISNSSVSSWIETLSHLFLSHYILRIRHHHHHHSHHHHDFLFLSHMFYMKLEQFSQLFFDITTANFSFLFLSPATSHFLVHSSLSFHSFLILWFFFIFHKFYSFSSLRISSHTKKTLKPKQRSQIFPALSQTSPNRSFSFIFSLSLSLNWHTTHLPNPPSQPRPQPTIHPVCKILKLLSKKAPHFGRTNFLFHFLSLFSLPSLQPLKANKLKLHT